MKIDTAIRKGKIVSIDKNMIAVEFNFRLKQNETAYALLGEKRLKSEVIRIRGNIADLQVYEATNGLKTGDFVEFTGKLLSVDLGPGLLGQVFDGLQNPLQKLAEECGFFLKRGKYLNALPEDKKWGFLPSVKPGDFVQSGDVIGMVKEGIFTHKIQVPFNLSGSHKILSIVKPGEYNVKEEIAITENKRGMEIPLYMSFSWPIKIPITAYEEKLDPVEPMITRIRIIDSLFPVAKGGTYCIPGPFGSGKTILQQITSRNAKVDIVIIAACGERAGEVVEIIRKFPKIIDPFTDRPLMERTVIICNTSSMPIAAREASVYTAITIAEYYRQMGLDVLLLADSTSRWAQALRERSGRLEEIPGEEAYPAYLGSTIAGFYERAGLVRLKDNTTGSITIGGTVSPAGGNFEEPVTQATLKVTGAFHGLSKDRSDARRYPSIDPLESWSTYEGIIDIQRRKEVIKLLSKANEVSQMMKVVGEEGVSLNDYILYLKGELFDYVYLQQNAFDPVDSATSADRQKKVFSIFEKILDASLILEDKIKTKNFFNRLRQAFIDYNYSAWDSEKFTTSEKLIKDLILQHSKENYISKSNVLRQAFVESDMDSQFRRSKELLAGEKGKLTMQKEESAKNKP